MRLPALLLAIAFCTLAGSLWAQSNPAIPIEQPETAPADLGQAPPFPPPSVEGQAPQPPPEQVEETPVTTPQELPEQPGADQPEGPAARSSDRPADRPAAESPEPSGNQPSPTPLTQAIPPSTHYLPAPEGVVHARGFAIVLTQVPIAMGWGSAVAATSLVATSVLLSTGNWPPVPWGLALAATPVFVSLLGGALSVVANMAVLPLVDLLTDAPKVPPGSLAKVALWSGVYAATIALVTGIPMSVPPAMAAFGLHNDASDMMGYAMAAAFFPIAMAPLANMEAANDAGYQSDLPLWCWMAMRICSFGTYMVW